MNYLKLLICDDEQNIRQGLKCILDWEELGYIICGEAANGKDAVSQTIDLNPDLIILDIKMPGLTGIEVLSQIKAHYEQNNKIFPSVVILSGFAEFQYSQEAINLGAKAYLLKPVDEDELEKKVRELTLKIQEQKNAEIQKENLIAFSQKDELIKILTGKEIPDSESLQSNFWEKESDSFFQSIILSGNYCSNFNPTAFEKSLENYYSFFENQIVCLDNKIIVCLKTQNSLAVEKCLERTAKLNTENTFIIQGGSYKGIEGLQKSYKEALSLESDLFFINDKLFLTSTNTRKRIVITNNNLNSFIDKFVFCIETYNKKSCSVLFQEYKDFLITSDTAENCKQLFIYSLMEIKSRLEKKHLDRDIMDANTKDVVPSILSSKTFTNCFDYFSSVIFNFIENFNFNTSDSVIVKVIAYVKSNYDKDLKLEVLGELFNCNSAYLGKKFTKYTGVQFNTYLDNIRIEAAKNKLLNSDLKIYQISKLVGYSNTDYFFMKFKKNTGLTPKEFQKMNGQVQNEQ